MEVLILAAITTASYLFILSSLLSWRFLLRHRVWFDVIFTFGVPILARGSYHGFATAIIAGLLLTLSLKVISLFYKV